MSFRFSIVVRFKINIWLTVFFFFLVISTNYSNSQFSNVINLHASIGIYLLLFNIVIDISI